MTRRRRLTLGLLALVLLLGLHPAAQAQEQETDSPDIYGADALATADEAPYMAAVLRLPQAETDLKGSILCGGVLITQDLVLTHASCITQPNGAPVASPFRAVLVNEDDVDDPGPDAEVVGLQQAERHPRWADGSDLALLWLDEPVENGAPIEFDRTGELVAPEDTTRLFGWGTANSGGATPIPGTLRRLDLDVLADDDEDCAAMIESPFTAENTLCAGYTGPSENGASPCTLDEGGPLVRHEEPVVEEVQEDEEEPAADVLVGVTRPVEPLCDRFTSVYTDVSAHTDYLDANIDATDGTPPFTDVLFGHPFLTEVWALQADGVIGGYPDGSFRSNEPVSRQAMSAFIYRLRGEPEFEAPATPTFADVPTNAPFYDEIEWMAAEGITTGYATTPPTYRPAEAVNRQAMSAFMYRTAGEPEFEAPGTPTFADVPLHHPFYDEIEWMAAEGITTGYPTTPRTFRPNEAVSRQAMSAFMARLQPLLELLEPPPPAAG